MQALLNIRHRKTICRHLQIQWAVVDTHVVALPTLARTIRAPPNKHHLVLINRLSLRIVALSDNASALQSSTFLLDPSTLVSTILNRLLHYALSLAWLRPNNKGLLCDTPNVSLVCSQKIFHGQKIPKVCPWLPISAFPQSHARENTISTSIHLIIRTQ